MNRIEFLMTEKKVETQEEKKPINTIEKKKPRKKELKKINLSTTNFVKV